MEQMALAQALPEESSPPLIPVPPEEQILPAKDSELPLCGAQALFPPCARKRFGTVRRDITAWLHALGPAQGRSGFLKPPAQRD